MGPRQAGALPVLIAGVLTSARDALGPVCAKPPSAGLSPHRAEGKARGPMCTGVRTASFALEGGR